MGNRTITWDEQQRVEQFDTKESWSNKIDFSYVLVLFGISSKQVVQIEFLQFVVQPRSRFFSSVSQFPLFYPVKITVRDSETTGCLYSFSDGPFIFLTSSLISSGPGGSASLPALYPTFSQRKPVRHIFYRQNHIYYLGHFSNKESKPK